MTAERTIQLGPMGTRLRDARLRRSFSLRSVAQALGESASLISQVENGKTQTHLGVSIDEVLGGAGIAAAPAADPLRGLQVQRDADNPVLEMENGVRWEQLAGRDGPADAIMVSYQPGASSSVEGKLMRHAGVEYAYVIEGSLTLQLDFDEYVLGPGDSLNFDSVRPHLYSNHGDVVARGIWFVAGRRQQNLAMAEAHGERSRTGRRLVSAVDVLRAMDDH